MVLCWSLCDSNEFIFELFIIFDKQGFFKRFRFMVSCSSFVVIHAMCHVSPFLKLFHEQPQLFSNQFDYDRWLFVPLASGDHWILVVVDLANQKILFFNSLSNESNIRYHNLHITTTLRWMKYFLSQRFSEYNFI